MKLWLTVAVAVLSLSTGFAQSESGAEARKKRAKMSHAERMQHYKERTGGLVILHQPGPVIAVVDAQGKVGKASFDKTIERLETTLTLPVEYRKATVKDPVKDVKLLLDFQTAAVIVCCDDPDLPMMLVAPEAKWAIMNIGKLAEGSPDDETLAKRFNKELWRTFCHLMGAADSRTPGCLMTTINSPKDLDKMLADTVCPEPYGSIGNTASRYGIKPNRIANYKRALFEGWAPPPADEYQKKIYDDFKAGKLQDPTKVEKK